MRRSKINRIRIPILRPTTVMLAIVGLVFAFQNCSGFLGKTANLAVATPTMKFDNASNQVMADLRNAYWTVDSSGNGHITPSWNGYVNVQEAQDAGAISSAVSSVQAWQNGNASRGGQWDRSTYLNVLFFKQKLSQSPRLAQDIQTDWDYVQSVYSTPDLTNCRDGGPVVYASDDAGWESLAFIHVYEATSDNQALADAKAMVDCTYSYYATSNNSQYGIRYSSSISSSGLYEVGLAMAAWEIYAATGELHYRDLAVHSYNWMQQSLSRPDGIYYMGFNTDSATVQGTDRPYDFSPQSSVTYLAGNMGMAVMSARLYADTGDTSYLQNALNTANGIAGLMLDGNGAFINDRDAWTEGAFAVQFAQEVLSLPNMPAQILSAVTTTARAIMTQDRTTDGYYGADWDGGSTWLNVGLDQSGDGMALPQQMYTSTQAADFVLAATALERQLKANPPPPAVTVSSPGLTDTAGNALDSSKFYKIKSVGSGKCLDVTGGNRANGTRIQEYCCKQGDINQAWAMLDNGDGTYSFRSRLSGRVMDLAAQTLPANGTVVRQFDSSGSPNQSFVITNSDSGGYSFASLAAPSSCVDIPAQSLNVDGTKLQVYTCNGANNQAYEFVAL